MGHLTLSPIKELLEDECTRNSYKGISAIRKKQWFFFLKGFFFLLWGKKIRFFFFFFLQENPQRIKAERALITNIPLQPEGFRNSLTSVWMSKTFMRLRIFITRSNMPQKESSTEFLPSNLKSNTFLPTGICWCSRMIHFGRQCGETSVHN